MGKRRLMKEMWKSLHRQAYKLEDGEWRREELLWKDQELSIVIHWEKNQEEKKFMRRNEEFEEQNTPLPFILTLIFWWACFPNQHWDIFWHAQAKWWGQHVYNQDYFGIFSVYCYFLSTVVYNSCICPFTVFVHLTLIEILICAKNSAWHLQLNHNPYWPVKSVRNK